MNDDFQQHIDQKYLSQLASAFSQPTAVEITMNTLDLFYYISYLQFAHRGAEEDEKTQSKIKEFTNRLIAILITVHPELEEIIATGWNPAYDIRSDAKEFNDTNAAIAAELIKDFEQEQVQAEPSQTKPHKIVHNLWTLYAAEKDGSVSETPFMCFGQRPQDWGHPRWQYQLYHYTREFEDQIITNICHTWTDWPDIDDNRHAELFAGVLVRIMQPGVRPELCSRDYLAEDDFWSKEWGDPPPYFEDDAHDDVYFFFGTTEDDAPDTLAAAPDKPIYELNLIVYINDDELGFAPLGQVTRKHKEFACVTTGYQTDDAQFVYNFYIAGLPANQPAIDEALFISANIEAIHNDFHQMAKLKDDKEELS